jgi:hypothetical protein
MLAFREDDFMKVRTNEPVQEDLTAPHRVRLPGFLLKEEIGLGDVIKKTTHAIGIPPCTACERRAAALNRWIRLTR